MAKKKKTKPILIPEGSGITPTGSSAVDQAARQPHMQTPIPPPAFIAASIREAKQKPAPRPEDDEIVAEGAVSDFWKILKRWVEQKQVKLKESTGQQIASGTLTLEQIGLKALWRDLVIDSFQDLVDFVENRAKIVEEMKREKQEAAAEEAKAKNESSGQS